ncbi:related to cytochrome b-type NAD(P)H oxidoreductase [Phialocephala subalpina]|uniref:Related to cytochrome b-type NAD(P)H oxidoreductase n=1 Tax=Phialocephala subalpina TaxID=576137 RepID=A0A1L7WT99_9HELO|nr:related to cytochrome b-type NAD(P)H oxidoreductase [Phialocephala subalpina]
MVLLGLSILIASVSFLCYRHPPSSWSFLQWLTRPIVRDIAKKELTEENDAPTRVDGHEGSAVRVEEAKTPVVTTTEVQMENKQDLKPKAEDSLRMPPPPPPFKRPTATSPSPPTTPRAPSDETTPRGPTFTHDGPEEEDEDYNAMPPPSFPALNSAQRTTGGTRPTPPSSSSMGPPRPNPIPQSSSGLMAPPARPSPLPNRSQGPIPNRNPISSGLAPPPTHTSIPAKPRKKVLLTPGHSPLDWARLTSSPTANLRNLPPTTPYLKVPPSLLKQYNGRPLKKSSPIPYTESEISRGRRDAWTVLGGKVYNMTPYLPYHPGGEPELLRVAGKDGSKLFGEVHPWVNWEGMLEGCLIGVAVAEEEIKQPAPLDEMD